MEKGARGIPLQAGGGGQGQGHDRRPGDISDPGDPGPEAESEETFSKTISLTLT